MLPFPCYTKGVIELKPKKAMLAMMAGLLIIITGCQQPKEEEIEWGIVAGDLYFLPKLEGIFIQANDYYVRSSK